MRKLESHFLNFITMLDNSVLNQFATVCDQFSVCDNSSETKSTQRSVSLLYIKSTQHSVSLLYIKSTQHSVSLLYSLSSASVL